MIYCDVGEHPFLFVRIPRTASTSIADFLKRHFPAAVWNDWHQRHATAAQLRDRFTLDTWGRMTKFAVARPPLEIIASYYRHTLAAVGDNAPHAWLAEIETAAACQSFDEYVQRVWLDDPGKLMRGGFWGRFCRDRNGNDLGVVSLRFNALADDFRELMANLGVDGAELPRLNSSSAGESLEIGDATRTVLLSQCWLDAELFFSKD